MGVIAQRTKTGQVIGVKVGIYRLNQLEPEVLHQLQIMVHFLQHWIDDQRLSAAAARQQVGVGARHRLKELTKNHGFSPWSAH
jgi:hypothetical protein